jgi:MoaA/NifB/PqqE/SkfB family radical SAM enzyme
MRCVFCALRHQSWAEERYEFITRELWTQYVEALGVWRPKVRVEIANRGEPTLHPEFLDLMCIGRAALPKAQFLVSTNGDLSDKIGLEAFRTFVFEALEAGVNCFLLDCYTMKRLNDFQALFKDVAGAFFDKSGSAKPGLNPYPYRGPDWKAISIKDAVPRPVKENVILQYHNQGGNAILPNAAAERLYPGIQVLEQPLERMCVRPFREMPMWFDGSVPICCDDWADVHIIGKFPEQSLPEIWDAYDEVRANLIRKDRGAQKPCNKCSERAGQRYGLELDWFKEKAKTA